MNLVQPLSYIQVLNTAHSLSGSYCGLGRFTVIIF
jgi:hypothetical protein